MSGRYAQTTSVNSQQSRAEIERILVRYGANAFSYGWSGTVAVIMFAIADRHIRFELPLPNRDDKAFTHTPGRELQRSVRGATEAYEQAVRQRWRALALVIKAKLEAVDTGITTVEQEFLAHIVLPNGATVGQWAKPQLEVAYSSNSMPELMPGVSGR